MTKPKKRTRIERNVPLQPESENSYEDPPYEPPPESLSDDSGSEKDIDSGDEMIAKFTTGKYFDAFGYAMSTNNRLNEEKSYTKYLETQIAILNSTIDKNFKLMDDYEKSIGEYDRLLKASNKNYKYLEMIAIVSIAMNIVFLIN